MKDPFPFQRDAIDLGATRNTLLGDKCGLGKTLEAIEATRRLLEMGGSALVICTKRAREQWLNEIKGQMPNTPVHIVSLYEPVKYEEGAFYIIHWDILVKVLPRLIKVWWRVVIADEAHRLSNRNNKWTKAIKVLHAFRKLALTATPMEKSPADIWSILNWLYPGHFSSYWKFCDKYVKYDIPQRETATYTLKINGKPVTVSGKTNFKHTAPTYRKIVGAQNQDELADELRMVMIQRTKEQVAPQLPPKIVNRVYVPMEDKQQELYDEVRHARDIIVDLEHLDMDSIMVSNVLTQIIRLQQISVEPSLLGGRMLSSKLEWLDDYITDNPEETMVVFSKFRETAVRLARKYDGALIVGGVLAHVDEFLKGERRLLFGTIAAMGESLNLQVAGTAIFLSQEWSSIKMEQAEDRVHRINITGPKYIIHLYSSSIDRMVLKALDHKWGELEFLRHCIEEVANADRR